MDDAKTARSLDARTRLVYALVEVVDVMIGLHLDAKTSARRYSYTSGDIVTLAMCSLSKSNCYFDCIRMVV